MKNTLLLAFSLLLISQTLFAQEEGKKPSPAFAELLEKTNMVFNMPEGYEEVKIVDNPHMLYEHAIKHETEEFEIRYAIRSLDGLIKDYEEREKNKKEGDVNVHPNGMYPSVAMAVGFNISGSMPERILPFPDESVKKDFGADKGCHTMVTPREGFAQGYKHCTMVVIQKDDVATAYCFFMFNDSNTFMKLGMSSFYSLRFE